MALRDLNQQELADFAAANDSSLVDVEAPNNTIYDEKNDRVLSLPQTLDADETQFIIDRDIDKKANFFGFVPNDEYPSIKDKPDSITGFKSFDRGVAAFFTSTPQVAGNLAIEASELAQDARQNPLRAASSMVPGRMDPAKALLTQVGLLFDRDGSLAEGGMRLIERNKEYMAKAGYAKKEGDGIGYDLGMGTGSMLSSIGVAALTRSPSAAAIMFGAMQKSQIYAEAREQGLDVQDASTISSIAGMAEMALEKVGLDRFLKAARGNSAVKRFVQGGLVEGLQEATQAAAEEGITEAAGIRNQSTEQIAENILYSAALGAMIGGPTSATLGAFVREEAENEGLPPEQAEKLAAYAEQNIDLVKQDMAEFIRKEVSPIAADQPKAMEFMTLMQKFDNRVDLVDPAALSPDQRAVFDEYLEYFNTAVSSPTGREAVEKEFYGRLMQQPAPEQMSEDVWKELAIGASKLIGARSDAAARALGITPREWLESKNLRVEVRRTPEQAKEVYAAKLEELRAAEPLDPAQVEDAQKRLDAARSEQKVAKGAKKPLIAWIRKQGGVTLGTPLAGELQAMGITPKTAPGFFKKGRPSGAGMFGASERTDAGDLDNIPASEFNREFGVAAVEDGNGYVDRDWLLDQIRNEQFGRKMTDDLAVFDDSFVEMLDKAGLDYRTATAEEVVQALGTDADVLSAARAIGENLNSQQAAQVLGIMEANPDYTMEDALYEWQERAAISGERNTLAQTQRDILIMDNPGGGWLDRQREDAKAAEARGNRMAGAVTAVAWDIELPVDFVAKVPGLNSEQRQPGEPQYDALSEKVAKEGFKKDSPILIGINYKGEAFIIEGNTRVAVAKANGIRYIPAEVKYFAGGEAEGGQLSPVVLRQLAVKKGDQITLEGAEKESQRTTAERGMEGRMKGGKPQKAMDIGMFGDEFKQTTLFQRQKITETPSFKKWFGKSKVVDSDGNPLVMYHGTAVDIQEFSSPNRASRGLIFVTKDPNFASGYAEARDGGEGGANVLPVYVSAKKIHKKMRWSDAQGYGAQYFKDRGYDAVRIIDDGGAETLAVLEPTQLKSVFNRGTFSTAEANILNQSAYHGSPYKFDKFTLEHIGKGEGAQSYGWGLYFAGKREVAEFYRDKLSKTNPFFVDGELVGSIEQLFGDRAKGGYEERMAAHIAFAELRTARGLEKAVRRLEKLPTSPERAAALELLSGLRGRDFDFDTNAGQLYEVKIPENDTLLDWDKPLSKQPKKVREALAQMGIKVDDKALREFDDALLSALEGTGSPDLPKQPRDPLGEEIYKALTRDSAANRSALQKKFGDEAWGRADKLASLRLNEFGIKGIKYLDGSSRSEGEGTSNYVVFEENAVEVLETFYQDGFLDPKGSISFGMDETVIRLFESADPSTLLHELGHLFLRDMRSTAAATKRPMVKRDYQIVKDWLGVKGNTFTEEQEEKFARGFEAWLREGKAPQPELDGIFARFKEWLTSIYRSIRQLDVEINDDIRQVFDRMLGGDFSRTEAEIKARDEQRLALDYLKVSEEPPSTFGADTGRIFRDLGGLANDAFTPVSTRLGAIDVKLKHAVRKFTFRTGLYSHEDRVAVKGFVEAVGDKFTPADYRIFDLALKNRDTVKAEELIQQYGIEKEWAAVREVLDNLYNEALDVGLDMGYIQDYFPRQVKRDKAVEYMGAIRQRSDWSEIRLALEEADPNKDFTYEEQAAFVNTYLRGFTSNRLNLTKPSFVKARQIDYVTPEFNQYYDDSMSTLLQYIGGLRHGIESRKLFGKSEKETEKNIGKYVLGLIDQGVISADQEKELTRILKAVVDPVGTRGAVSWGKNAGYVYLMGNPISAITQIQDLAFSLALNGFYRTAGGLGRSIVRRPLLRKEEIGIDNILQEFENETRASNTVRKVFKIVGLEFFDNVGKETYITAAYGRLRAANKKGSKEFKQQLDDIFGSEAAQVSKDLEDKVMSENVKYLLFSELSDVQPISLAEMPIGYLRGGNGRVFYMLKTYTVKQIDIYRNKIFDEIASGEPARMARGVSNLVRLAAALMLMGMGSDALKDLVLGRPVDLDELVIDNILKTLTLTKYQIYKAKEEGIANTFWKTLFVPPVAQPVDDVARDIANIGFGDKKAKDAETLGRVPVVGKFYYWWWGGGRTKLEKEK